MTRTDLHIHSTASDGQLTPSEVVDLALHLQLDCIAITDHDTTAGILAAQQAADGRVRIIPGIEIGARSADMKVDILGYCIDPQHSGLQQRLEAFRLNRQQRGQQIVERLNQLSVALEWSHVVALAGGENVGRPHIARALVEAGHVRTTTEAFERYIGSSQPAYVPRVTLTPEEAIRMIHSAGGAAVLAHPVYVRNFPVVIEHLVPAGLDGLEVAYPQHTPEIEAHARQLAQQYGLVMTGGSDFHGLDMPDKAMLGSTLAPEGAVDALFARARQYARL